MAPIVFAIGSPYVLRDVERFLQEFTYVEGSHTNAADGGLDYVQVDHLSGLAHVNLFAGQMYLGTAILVLAAASGLAAW